MTDIIKAIIVENFGEPEEMRLVETEESQPEKNQVLIKVKAIGVNPVETYIRSGVYPLLPDLPYTPGGNISGVIEKCGPGCGHWQAGDRVYSSATLGGGYSEKAICTTDQIFHLPENISFEQGAAIGVPAATAYRALFLRGGGQKGDRVLIHGASGSVGQSALQLAKNAGMNVSGTAGTDQGLEIIAEFGAKPYNHRESDYIDKLQVENGAGFDLILEMLANKNLERDLELLAPSGRVVIIGNRGRIEIDPRLTMGKESDIRGLSLFNATQEETVQTHKSLARAMEDGSLVPKISRELPLGEAPLAHKLVMEDGNCGKIILVP